MQAFADQQSRLAHPTGAKSFRSSITKVALLGNSTAGRAADFAENKG
jgi:hypothetical protein